MTLEQFSAQPQVGIRTDCYSAVLPKFRKQYPRAHFEVVMRFPYTVGLIDYGPSELSPSKNLLQRYKRENLSFDAFIDLFKTEIFANYLAIERMRKLQQLSQTKLVFLVCCERDASQCHRSYLKQWILDCVGKSVKE